MKVYVIVALLGMLPRIVHAQTPAYHWEVNGVPVPGATSVAFVMDPPSPPPQKDTAAKPAPAVSERFLYASKMLHRYKVYHFTGGIMEVCGATMIAANLLEMNRTGLPKSNYTTFYVIGGGLSLAGYVINQFIAPGFVSKAGVAFRDGSVCLDLDR